MASRTRWDDSSFDVVLDKAMLDALLTSKLAASATANGNSPTSRTDAGSATEAAPDRQPANRTSAADASEQPEDSNRSSWTNALAGDLSAARAYLAETHRLLTRGDTETANGCMLIRACKSRAHVAQHLEVQLHPRQ